MAVAYQVMFLASVSGGSSWCLFDFTFLLPCYRPSQFFIHSSIKAAHRQRTSHTKRAHSLTVVDMRSVTNEKEMLYRTKWLW